MIFTAAEYRFFHFAHAFIFFCNETPIYMLIDFNSNDILELMSVKIKETHL